MLNHTEYGFNIKANRNIYHKNFHLLYRNDKKLYAGSKKRSNDLFKISSDFSADIHMDFGLEKCKIVNIENRKRNNGDSKLPNGDIKRKILHIEKGNGKQQKTKY